MPRAEAAEQTFHSPQVAIWRKLRRIPAKFLWGMQAPKAVWMKKKVVGSGCGGAALSPTLALSSRCQGIFSIFLQCCWEYGRKKNAVFSEGRLWEERSNYNLCISRPALNTQQSLAILLSSSGGPSGYLKQICLQLLSLEVYWNCW